MPSDGNEPQSYGSGEDWVTGETGEEVNPPKSSPAPEHQEFYKSRHDSEGSAPHQGGHTSDVQLAECASGGDAEADGAGKQPATKVTSKDGGAKHDSFFRKRDYS
ncbi:MAG TPA: hypothetical protein VFV49_16260 [Thermoanaerobaculia bacterium]|nr:hypothetical protein [Thermoanaerobaculia bacterium]